MTSFFYAAGVPFVGNDGSQVRVSVTEVSQTVHCTMAGAVGLEPRARTRVAIRAPLAVVLRSLPSVFLYLYSSCLVFYSLVCLEHPLTSTPRKSSGRRALRAPPSPLASDRGFAPRGAAHTR